MELTNNPEVAKAEMAEYADFINIEELEQNLDLLRNTDYGEGYIIARPRDTEKDIIFITKDINWLALQYHYCMVTEISEEMERWIDQKNLSRASNYTNKLALHAFEALASGSHANAVTPLLDVPQNTDKEAMLSALVHFYKPDLARGIVLEDPKFYTKDEPHGMQKAAIAYVFNFGCDKVLAIAEKLKANDHHNLITVTPKGWTFKHREFSTNNNSVFEQLFLYDDLDDIIRLENHIKEKLR